MISDLFDELKHLKEEIYYQKNGRFAKDYSIYSSELSNQSMVRLNPELTPHYVQIYHNFLHNQKMAQKTLNKFSSLSKKQRRDIFSTKKIDQNELIHELGQIVNVLQRDLKQLEQIRQKKQKIQCKILISNIEKQVTYTLKGILEKSEKIRDFIVKNNKSFKQEKEESRLTQDDSIHFEDFFDQSQIRLKREKQKEDQEMQEIDKLTRSIYEVKQFFIKMQDMVFEQGTIIDRIDYNILDSMTLIEQSNRNL